MTKFPNKATLDFLNRSLSLEQDKVTKATIETLIKYLDNLLNPKPPVVEPTVVEPTVQPPVEPTTQPTPAPTA